MALTTMRTFERDFTFLILQLLKSIRYVDHRHKALKFGRCDDLMCLVEGRNFGGSGLVLILVKGLLRIIQRTKKEDRTQVWPFDCSQTWTKTILKSVLKTSNLC